MAVANRSKSNLPDGLLGNRNFILLWCAYAVSAMGDHLSEMAILRSQDALSEEVDVTPIFARMTFVFFIPFFVLGPIAGLLADRAPRRTLMVAADVARFAILLSFGAMIGWASRFDSQWGPVAPIILVGLFAAMFSPARSALLPTLIRPRQLVRANGMIAGVGIIATMVSLRLGGELADGGVSAQMTFRLDAATFAVSAILLLLMRLPRGSDAVGEVRASPTTFRTTASGLRAGFRYVRDHRSIFEMLLIAGIVWFCGALIKSSVPAVVKTVYGGTFKDIGGYLAYLGVGFMLGAAAVTWVGDSLRSEIAITWGLMGIAASTAVFAASVFLPFESSTLGNIGALGILGGGFFGVVTLTSFNALLQRLVPNRYRGRIFGIKDLFTTAALLLATGTLGIPQWENLDRWVGWILVGVALVTFATGLTTLMVRVRRSPYAGLFMLLAHLTEFVAKFWWRLVSSGPRIPRSGGVLITSNHTCYADPLMICAASPYRKISFLVAAEYCKLPIIRFFLNQSECIPVKRDGQDSTATREVLRRLRGGKAVGIFIEGRIIPPGETGEPRDGLALLALRTGVPVIPVYISGTHRSGGLARAFLGRHRAHVQFGKPVDLSEFKNRTKDRQAVKAATKKIYAAIQALAPID